MLLFSIAVLLFSIFSNFWDSYFSSYGEFGEFTLKFTAACSAVAVFTKKAARRRGLWTSLALLQWAAAGPRTLAGPRLQIGDTMNKGGPLTMQNVTWRR